MAKKVTTGVSGNNADMYQQNRGSNGQFGTGKSMKTTRGGKNPMLYYDAGEMRKITTASGRRVSASTFDNLVNQSGAKSDRRLQYT